MRYCIFYNDPKQIELKTPISFESLMPVAVDRKKISICRNDRANFMDLGLDLLEVSLWIVFHFTAARVRTVFRAADNIGLGAPRFLKIVNRTS